MLFDTDVLIWVLRGNEKAAKAVEEAGERSVSVVTLMELIQGARNREETRTIKKFLLDFGFRLLPLTENIGHRASIYMEEHAPSAGMEMADALIAAAAVENSLALCTGNLKHYRPVKDLVVKLFRP